MDPKIWREQIATYSELSQFSKKVPSTEDVCTMDILQSTRDARLQLMRG